MKRIFTAFCFFLPLAGCAASRDQDGLRNAAMTLHREVFACETRHTANPVKTYSGFTACQVAAERSFATAIHLKNMDAFETYAARMMQLAAERDASNPPLEEVRQRVATIRNEYLAACDCKIAGRRMAASNRSYWQGDTGTFFQPSDPGPAMIGGVVFNGR